MPLFIAHMGETLSFSLDEVCEAVMYHRVPAIMIPKDLLCTSVQHTSSNVLTNLLFICVANSTEVYI